MGRLSEVIMRFVAMVIAALLTLALAAFAAQKAVGPVIAHGISAAHSASLPASAAPVASGPVAEMSDATSVTRSAGGTGSDPPTQLAQTKADSDHMET